MEGFKITHPYPVTLRLNDFIIQIRNDIKGQNFIQADKRFNRETYSSIGHVIKIPMGILNSVKTKTPLEKYEADFQRMTLSFDRMIAECNENPDSRQLVVVNTENYLDVQPCFLSMQFLKKDFDYKVIVYQRSGDVEKLEDDLICFADVIKRFETQTKQFVNEVVIVYGSLHYTKK